MPRVCGGGIKGQLASQGNEIEIDLGNFRRHPSREVASARPEQVNKPYEIVFSRIVVLGDTGRIWLQSSIVTTLRMRQTA